MKVAARIVISGRVQGVGFRYFVYRRIISDDFSSLTGYVRNLRSGEVEVFLEGDRGIIEALLPVLNSGPSYSQVTGMDLEWFEYEGRFDFFEIRS